MKAFVIYKHIYSADGSRLIIGGIETYLVALTQVLKARGLEPVVVQCAERSFVIRQDEVEYRGIVCSTDANYPRRLYNVIRDELHTDDLLIWGTDTYSTKVGHEKTIAIQHGIDFDYYPVENKWRRLALGLGLGHCFKYLQRRRARAVFNRSAYKVCVDYNFWNWYRTFCLPEEERSIFVIPNFSYTDKPRLYEANVEAPLQVLFARRFVRRRGVEEMIKVVEHFAGDKRFHFTFAGDGDYCSHIERLQGIHDNVSITKYEAKDSLAFHRGYDVAIIPTIGSEGTSFSLLEAMAVGIVPICTYVGGMTNIVLDGFNGLFVRPESAYDIVSKLELLAQDRDLLSRISQSAQATIDHSFSFDRWQERWNEVLDKVGS